MHIDEVLKRLRGVVSKGGGQYMALCPCHADQNPSLAVRMGDKGIVFYCQAGCQTSDVVASLGLTMQDVCADGDHAVKRRPAEKAENAVKKKEAKPFYLGQGYTSKLLNDEGKQAKRQEVVTAVYSYRDRDGKEVLQVARTDHKSFPVIHNKDGNWYWGDGGNTKMLYRLPDLVDALAKGQLVCIVEGEKDVDNLWDIGIAATCNKGGAGKWPDDKTLNKLFSGAKVIIIPDNDDKGWQHAKKVAQALKGIAKELRMLNLRKLDDDLAQKGDVSDLIAKYGDRSACDILTKAFKSAPVYSRIVDDRAYAEYFDAVDGYSVKNGCICAFKDEGWRPLCNFTALPIAEIVRDDGSGELSTSFNMIGWDSGGRRLQEINVSADEFAKMGWPLKKWGLAANIRSGNNVKEKLREAMQSAGNMHALRRLSYSHTGWREVDGKPVYLHGGGAIGAEDVSVELDYGFNRYDLSGVVRGELMDLSPRDRLSVCIGETFSCMSIAGLRVGLPLVSYMFLTPLRHFLQKEGRRPSFIPFVRGRTGSGKSVMTSLVMNHFGRDFSYDTAHPASFDDTANGISLKLFLLKDMPLLIDDYHPESNPNRRRAMEDVAQRVARMVGDGARRSRMRNDASGQVDKPARGLCIETGEELPYITESGVARMYVIDLVRGDVPLGSKELTRLQRAARDGCFSEVMRAYIEWLLLRYEQLPKELDLRYAAILEEAIQRVQGAHARIPPVVAYLMLGYRMFLDFVIEKGFLSRENSFGLIEKAWTAILENTDRQVIEMKNDKPTQIFLEVLKELMDNRKVALNMISRFDGAYWSSDKNLIGYHDKDYYYLSPGVTYEAVQRSMVGQGVSFPLGKNMLLKLLADEGISERDPKTGANVKQLNRGGAKGRFIWIPKSKVDGEKQQELYISEEEGV